MGSRIRTNQVCHMQKRILFVDDDPIISHVYKLRMEKAGYDIHLANSGSAAFAKLGVLCPDAIVLDLLLHGENGVEIVRKIRIQPKFESTPILVLTALPSTDLAREGLIAGANKVFSKIDDLPSDIIDALREMFDLRREPKG